MSSSSETTEPVSETPSETIRTSTRSGLRDSALGTRNLMTTAALAVVGSLIVVPLTLVSPLFATTPRGLFNMCLLMGAWLVAYILPGIIVARPGAVMIAGLLMGIITSFTTPLGPSAIIGNLIGALFIEFPLALLLYRKWTWWSFGLGATIFGALNAAMMGGAYGIPLSSSDFAINIGTAVTSCWLALAACLALQNALKRAGVGVVR